ncbi:hypothetical protein J5N97_004139 [Dioscorea zingiberensis]|uniref:TF-B3 domain-containing protein n=1 Tax=Dioscorea zingiberensis TaxID=325984 RepID=A0A9D5D628_9LILI|nr:hypothetical protein J5N97_004139 [Dioscorea zingiberensis]
MYRAQRVKEIMEGGESTDPMFEVGSTSGSFKEEHMKERMSSHLKCKVAPGQSRCRTSRSNNGQWITDPYNTLRALIDAAEDELRKIDEIGCEWSEEEDEEAEKEEEEEIMMKERKRKSKIQPKHQPRRRAVMSGERESKNAVKWEGPPPEWFVQTTRNNEKVNLTHIFGKILIGSDVEAQQNRLLLPRKETNNILLSYLTESEREELAKEIMMGVKVIDRHDTKYDMSMKFYNVINAHRIISPGWKNFVRNNELQGDRDAVFLWAFRVQSELWFAIDHCVNPSLEAGANEGDVTTTVETGANEGDGATTGDR